MTKLIDFITSFGSVAELRALSKEELKAVMVEKGLSEHEITVILSGDREAIVSLVKDAEQIVCAFQTPDEPEDEPQEPEEPKEDSPSSRLAS